MAYKAEYQTYGDPKYYGNGVVVETADEAHQMGRAKRAAWTMCENYQIVETDEPVNFEWVTGVGLREVTHVRD